MAWFNWLICGLLLATGILIWLRLARVHEHDEQDYAEDYAEDQDRDPEMGPRPDLDIGLPRVPPRADRVYSRANARYVGADGAEYIIGLNNNRFTTAPPPPFVMRLPPETHHRNPNPRPNQAAAVRILRRIEPVTATPPPGAVRSDQQNVHDSVLLGHLKAALDAFPLPSDNNLRGLREYLKGNKAATRTLDTMESNVIPLSALHMTEAEAVARVWGVIEGREDRDERRRVLAERLAEGNEEGSCATGRVARVVDSLSAVDDRVQLKPTWALRRELLDKAAALARDHDEATQGPLVDVLRKEFRREYVDTGLVPAARLKAELDEWGGHLS